MQKLDGYLRFLEIGEPEVAAAKAAWTLIKPHIPELMDQLYDHFFEIGFKPLFEGKDVAHIKAGQSAYWQALFTGKFTTSYIRSTEHIYRKHQEAGVGLAEYVGTYAWLSVRFLDIVAQSTPPPSFSRRTLMVAINKVIHLDMMIAAGSVAPGTWNSAQEPNGDRDAHSDQNGDTVILD